MSSLVRLYFQYLWFVSLDLQVGTLWESLENHRKVKILKQKPSRAKN